MSASLNEPKENLTEEMKNMCDTAGCLQIMLSSYVIIDTSTVCISKILILLLNHNPLSYTQINA